VNVNGFVFLGSTEFLANSKHFCQQRISRKVWM